MAVDAHGGAGSFIGGRTVIFRLESSLLVWCHRKPSPARRHIPRDTLGILIHSPKCSTADWAGASWVAVNLMHGLDRSVG